MDQARTRSRTTSSKATVKRRHNSESFDFLAGGGEMGNRIRDFDWSKTSLGPISTWPQSLKTAVRIILTSRQPFWLGWGPDLIKLYNDAYKSIVGGKHPEALGQPASVVWREIWPEIGPMLETAMEGVEGTYVEEQLLIMDRNGYSEETYYTFSYSPIPDDDGKVGGIICANTEDTARVVGNRQGALLRELASRTADAREVAEACRISGECLGINKRDVAFGLIYLIEKGSGIFRLVGASDSSLERTALAPAVAGSADEFPWPLSKAINGDEPALIADLAQFKHLPQGAWQMRPAKAALIKISALGEQDQRGVAVIGLNPYRLLDASYRDFLHQLSLQIGTNIRNASAYEAERKRAEALAELDRAKTAFFSNVSHEFRTPLTLMLGPLEDVLLNANASLSSNTREQLLVAQRNSLRLLRLVNTLLDFSRIEAGRVEARFEATDLAAFTTDLCSVFRSMIEKAGIRFVVDCTPLDEPVFVDREMWEKIVLNLLSNAFKFTFEGEIAVRLVRKDSSVELHVCDSGIGIPDKELSNIFKRFHRVEGAKGRSFEGSGIGLALVTELAKLHGGDIRVQSASGRGSEFIVSVPIGTSHLSQEQIVAAAGRAFPTAKVHAFVEEAQRWFPPSTTHFDRPIKKEGSDIEFSGNSRAHNAAKTSRVLIADDNADMRDYVARLLATNYEVMAVADGQSALAALSSFKPNLVLSDVMMPGLDGPALLQAIRADPQFQATPVILLSARAGEESRLEGFSAGADDYLIKPFSARELVTRVESHLNIARLRREAFERERALSEELETQRKLAYEILESISDAFVAFDYDWRFTYLNRTGEELLGKPAAELLGKIHWDVFPATVGTVVETEFRRAVADQVIVEFENFYTPWQRWFEVKAYPSPQGLGVYFRDVTERKNKARKIEVLNEIGRALSSELKLEKLVQSVIDAGRELTGADYGAFFHNSEKGEGESHKLDTISGGDPNVFAEFSLSRKTPLLRPTVRENGVRIADLLTDPRGERFFPERGVTKAPQVRSYLVARVKSRSGEELGQLLFGHSEPNKFTDESEQLLEGIAAQAGVAIDNANLYRAIENELAAHKRAEEALRRSETQLREATAALKTNDERFRLAAFSEAITLYEQDADLRYLWLYPLHPEHEHALGKRDADLLQTEEGQQLIKLKREVMTEGKARRHEIRTTLATGVRIYDVFIQPRRNSEGEIVGVAGTALDITDRKVAESALRESEERLAAELRATTLLYEIGTYCASAAVDSQSCLLRIVDAAIAITGASKGNLQMVDGKTGSLVIAANQGFDPAFLDHFSGVKGHTAAACAKAMAAGKRVIIEDITKSEVFAGSESLNVMMAAGARAVQSTPLISSSGKLLGMISTHYSQPYHPTERELRMIDLLARQTADYLERRQVEEALRQSEIRLRTMAESLPNLVWTCLPDGACDWLSSQWTRYTGIPVKEMLGTNWADRVVHPDDRERTLATWRAACENRGDYDLEYRIRRHDGQYHWFKTRGVPIRDDNGKINYWFGTCTDIEDIKRGQLAIERLAAIVESSDDAIIGKDLNGKITTWNNGASRIFGYTAEEAIGKPITILIPEDRLEEEPGFLSKIRRGERIDHFETIRKKKDGTLFNISITVSPIRDVQGQIIGASKVARDITDRVRAKEKLELTVAERTSALRDVVAELEAFSYSIAHDMRAPLRAMNSYAQIVREDYSQILPEEGRDFLERIGSSARRLDALITDVLNYSRISRGEMPLETIDVEVLVREVIDSYADIRAWAANISIVSPLPAVRANKAALTQCISNLLSNALKFTRDGVLPKIAIRSENRPGAVRIWIEDNGIGISEPGRKRIFNMFQRLNPSPNFAGTGIGLTIVRKAVERMGGQVGVESTPNVGSRFWIELPAGR